MKKDKEKNQPTTTGGAKEQISSATLTLQLLNKEKIKEAEKKDSAAEAVKVRCKTCFKEIAPTPRCFGHGGGGGGGSDAGSDKASDEKASPGEDKSLTQSDNIVETTDELLSDFAAMGDSKDLKFDPEIIAELIAQGLLLVDSDRESMTLTIKLLYEFNTLTEEQRDGLKKFMEVIIKEFNEFKEENSLSDDCMKLIPDEKGNILALRITLPTLVLYDAFIQRLANNLVPMPNQKAQEKDEVTKDQRLAPNPLSMKPKPSNKDKLYKQEKIEPIEPKKVGEEEEQKSFNPSPFNMKPL